MKRFLNMCGVTLLAGSVILTISGCDWSSGGGTNSFNTSQGAGVNLNFSGVYRGELAGGKVVGKTSAGNIQTLTISQTGNRLTIVDNQGSRYSGSVGAPGLVALPDGTIPAGAEFVQSQISFTGKDGVSARDIEFVGIIHAISVTDIQGNSTEKVDVSGSGSGSTNFNNSGSSSGSRTETTRTFAQGTNIVQETVLTIGTPADAFYDVTVTTVTFDAASGQEISRNVTTTRNQGSGSGNSSSSGSTSTTTTFTDFQITEANTQYRLEGTWIEQGGVTSGVKARSPGSSGTIQTTSTETAPAP
jgi:hypothetical protein